MADIDILEELKWRGLVYQTTDDANLAAWLNEKPRTVYAGFDPTSSSLHVGNLMPLLGLRRFQLAGHRPIALVGGATGMIGDPSGKSNERNLLSRDALRDNVVSIRRQLEQFLDFDCGPNSALLLNNYDWLQNFSYLDFLRDVGKNVPVNVMRTKDSVQSRLDRDDGGISYTEFSYMLLQGYDFVHLYEHHDCELQIGGSDQWGNITLGVDLTRRMRGAKVHGATFPLLLRSDGTKMGKTEEGSVWLSADRFSPYRFYQYWINVTDEDVGRCLRFLTELTQTEVEALDAARREQANRNESQTRLAEELTRLVHGEEGLLAAQRASKMLFGGEIVGQTDASLNEIFADVPSGRADRDSLSDGVSLVEAFVLVGLAKSKSDARRSIQGGGGYVNNQRVKDVDYRLTTRDLASESFIVLRAGKKRFALMKFPK